MHLEDQANSSDEGGFYDQLAATKCYDSSGVMITSSNQSMASSTFVFVGVTPSHIHRPMGEPYFFGKLSVLFAIRVQFKKRIFSSSFLVFVSILLLGRRQPLCFQLFELTVSGSRPIDQSVEN